MNFYGDFSYLWWGCWSVILENFVLALELAFFAGKHLICVSTEIQMPPHCQDSKMVSI